MAYLLSTFWVSIALAFLLGCYIGWAVYEKKLGWSALAAVLFVVGVVVAVMKILPGSFGLWLETLLLLFFAYTVGGVLGAFARLNHLGTRPAVATTPVAAGVAAAAAFSGSAVARSGGTASTRGPDSFPGQRPAGLTGAVGSGDDLTLIKGVGPVNKSVLNGLGVHKFEQIAGWNAAECTWVGHKMAFPGRVEREHWVDQAKLLAAGGDTAFSSGVKSGAIKIDAKADAPVGEADIAGMKQDIAARQVAANAKAAEAQKAADAARAAEAQKAADAAGAAEVQKAADAARAAEAQKVADAAKAAEAQKAADAAKVAEAQKAADAARAAEAQKVLTRPKKPRML